MSAGHPTTMAYVESGLQALNLVEYQAATGERAAVVVVPTVAGSPGPDQAVDVLRTFDPEVVIYRQRFYGGWLTPGRNAEPALQELLQLADRIGPVRRLVLGEYRQAGSWMLARALGLAGEDVVLVDDGGAVLRIDRTDPAADGEMPAPASGLPYAPLDGLTFFTAYPEAMRISSTDRVIENRREALRTTYAGLPADESVVFVIGSPVREAGLIEDDGVDVEIAHALVEEARRWRPDAAVAYVPHRRESGHKLARVGERCEVMDFGLPFELVPPRIGMLPTHYLGTVSSLFTNLAALAPERVRISIWRIPEMLVAAQYREGVERSLHDLARRHAATVQVGDLPLLSGSTR